MLQQTTVKTVAPYYAKFLARWPTVEALAKRASTTCCAPGRGSAITPARAICTPAPRPWSSATAASSRASLDALRALPGIGDYTAAAVAAIAFDAPAVPVDGNVERVVARLFALEEELPAAKATVKRLAASLLPPRRAGDFAQSLMDLGATICSPKRPACALCPWNEPCVAFARGEQETFPRKAPKREGKLRYGAAFVALRADGHVLLRRRPEKGLLGGMTEVPGSDWAHDFEIKTALRCAPRFRGKTNWRRLPGVVRHVFTHFPLELNVFVAQVARNVRAPKGARWAKITDLPDEALPNVMRKVIAHAFNG